MESAFMINNGQPTAPKECQKIESSTESWGSNFFGKRNPGGLSSSASTPASRILAAKGSYAGKVTRWPRLFNSEHTSRDVYTCPAAIYVNIAMCFGFIWPLCSKLKLRVRFSPEPLPDDRTDVRPIVPIKVQMARITGADPSQITSIVNRAHRSPTSLLLLPLGRRPECLVYQDSRQSR